MPRRSHPATTPTWSIMRLRSLFFVASAVGALSFSGSELGAQSATSVCKDGTSSSVSGRGACSGHGGIDAKATAAAKKAEKKSEKIAKSDAKAAAEVVCTDGTTSAGGQGACSRHGGIKTAGATAPAAAARPTSKPAPSLPASVPASPPAPSRSRAKSAAPAATKAASKRGEDTDPTDAIAQCKDGMYSHAANHRGACSKHGGVSKFLKP